MKITPIPALSGGFLTLQYFLCLIFPDLMKYISLTPANLLITNNFIWILVTSSFFEVHWIRYLFDILLLILISRDVYHSYPLDQFSLYFLLNIICCSFGTILWLFYRFYLSNSEFYLIENVYGFGGILMSLLMITRQQLKSSPVVPQYPFLTFHYLPTLILFLFTFLWLLGLHFLTKDISFIWMSYFFSWTYLRFFFKYSVSYFLPLLSRDDSLKFFFSLFSSFSG